ncbi:MAG TPA: TetR family transcriptional regulator [Spirochaetia bacterium]|nr:TetR family transcriptional regulator [Spirochaetia bacterium]
MAVRPKGQKSDPRITRTRALIEDAFLAVMEDKGFEDLTVNDVTERAGINRVTFYSHFVDKYALLGDTIRKSFLQEIERHDFAARELSVDSVRDLFLSICSYVTALYGHCKPPHTHLDWVVEAQVTDLSAELFRAWAGKSDKSGSAKSVALIATAASSAMYGLVLQWLRTKKRTAASTFVRTSLPVVTGILGLSI